MNFRSVSLIVVTALIVWAGAALYHNRKVAIKDSAIVASFYPMGYFAQEVAGSYADVITLVGSDTEPHDYELTTQDVAQMERAKVVVVNGGVEPWVERVKENLSGSKVVVVTAGEGLLTRHLEEGEHAEGEELDPHVWLDPVLAQEQVQKIVSGLQQADPDHAQDYATNGASLIGRLGNLHQQFLQGLQQCARTDIVTSHAAFGYLADRYKLNQIAIAGLSPEEEPSTQDLVEVAQFVKDHNVRYIFFESLVSPELAQVIATETGAQTLELNPLEGLTNEENTSGATYFTVMEQNLRNLRTALQCQ